MADKVLTLAVRTSGVFFIETWDCRHLAMVRLAAQPTEKCALQMLGVETIGFGPPVLAGDGDACRVDNEGLEATSPQPPRQPKTIATGLKGDRYACDRMPSVCGASSRQRCSNRSSASSSAPTFFNG
nr:hypothetical protein [Bradyrhizobium manausense]